MPTSHRRGEHGPGSLPGEQDAQPSPAQDEPVAVDLQARVADLESKLDEADDRHLRLAADFDNFRKRARQEQKDLVQHANQRLIEALLPVLDDLHLALDHAPASVDDSWVKGLDLSVQKLEEILAAQGVEGIEAVGRPFDPKLHEAVGAADSDAPEDTVVQELRRGYRFHDRVLRPSLVRVARRPVPT